MVLDQSRSAARSRLLVGASLVALFYCNPAYAQDATSPPPPPPTDQVTPPTDDQGEANLADQAPPSEAPADTETGKAIVVTGSRIRQVEFTSPDPVTSIDPELAIRQGKTDTAEMLQSSPIAAGSTQITSAISSNFVTNGGPGSETIDLRGLGANRTLVLLNGRRAGPAGTRGGVSSFDLNVLPQSIVQRVEVLKTGASSIYGSDAVAGVVNLITKTDVDGLQIDGAGNMPTRDGGSQGRISVLWGKKFDRGHIMVAADYFHQQELARGDRNYLGCPEPYVFTDESHSKRADLIDPRTGKPACLDLPWGHVWTYDLEYLFEYGPGNLRLSNGEFISPLPAVGGVDLIQYQYPGQNLGVPGFGGCGVISCFGAPPGWFATGYDQASQAIQNNFHPYPLEQSLIPEMDRYTLYADASYDITDNVELYGEFLGNRRKSYQNGWRQIWTFGGTEDFYGTYWAPGWTGWNWLSPTAITNHSDTGQTVDYWRGVGGVRGDFGGFMKGWSFDTFVQYSHNKGVYRTEQFLQDIYDVSYFQTASCVGQTLPFSGKQCMDLPWTDPNFLAGQFTPEQADYMFDWETGTTYYTQLSSEASITGNLFSLPAGPVGAAFGVDYRRDAIEDTPGNITYAANPYYDASIPATDPRCTNHGYMRFYNYPCQAFHSNAWGNTASGITAGHSTTMEAFGEVQVPLLRDQPFFQELSLSGAARVTSVKTIQRDTGISDSDNGNWTYKIGGNWAVNNWVRFRGTYGTSFRSPALFEQLKANETSFPRASNIDPCINWGSNLERHNISDRIAQNCASQGIPSNYPGATITPTAYSQGGIGVLDPETSTAKTASVIFTPRFAFLPDTHLSLAVDYFDIKVKGEVTQLGARNIMFGCYDSDTFPTDPLCDLFSRGTQFDPYAVTEIRDKYVNINQQRNSGIDVTALIQQRLGRFGRLNLLGQMTWQLKDTYTLFAGTTDSFNGEIGDPKWVGDFNATWLIPGGWTFFWGMDVYGAASNVKRYEKRNGDLCSDSSIFGHYCVDVTVPATFYHSASITKDFAAPMNLELTIGVANLFDTKPPRVSTLGGSGIPSEIGPVVGTSQYDFLGRRVFINFSKKF